MGHGMKGMRQEWKKEKKKEGTVARLTQEQLPIGSSKYGTVKPVVV